MENNNSAAAVGVAGGSNEKKVWVWQVQQVHLTDFFECNLLFFCHLILISKCRAQLQCSAWSMLSFSDLSESCKSVELRVSKTDIKAIQYAVQQIIQQQEAKST